MNSHLTPSAPKEHFDENTLFKVYDALRAAGLTEKQSRGCISEMQNAGILFRERVSTPPVTAPVYRGMQEEAVPVAENFLRSTGAVDTVMVSETLLKSKPRGFQALLNREPLPEVKIERDAAMYDEIKLLVGRGILTPTVSNDEYRAWRLLDESRKSSLPLVLQKNLERFGEIRWYNAPAGS